MSPRFTFGRSAVLTGILGAVALVVASSQSPLTAASTTPVADAAQHHDLATVQKLVSNGTDVNAAQNDGLTALHWAAIHDDVPMANVLLYAGADVSVATRVEGTTPLQIAARDGSADMVEALLTHHADAQSANVHGTTALMLAAESGSVPAITALLNAGAQVNVREHVRGETALMYAAAFGRADAVKVLMAHGADWKPTTGIFDWTKLKAGDVRLMPLGGGGPSKATTKNAKAEGGAEQVEQEAPAKTGDTDDKEDTEVLKDPRLRYPRLVGKQGGLSALLFAARQGYTDAAMALVAGGADVNQADPGDDTTPLMIAIVNGHFDLAEKLLASGADPNRAQTNGAAPLYAVLNCVWSPKTLYPQPTAYAQQQTSYLQLMKDLLAHGAKPNVRLQKKVWYSGYNFDQSGLDETGATPFWRAAWADDVDAMKLLMAHGADPRIATRKVEERRRPGAPADAARAKDPSGLAPVPDGGPDVTPLLAASGEAYGSSFTSNHHRYAPAGMLAAVKYLVEDLHADVNEVDADGNTALLNAASRGDNAMILYLVSRGANVKAVNRRGQTAVDLANGPMQRISPFPETMALLQRLGAKLMHACVSC
ncbi:MAG TPA: ankyrin repeat domain-containing protein [Vicinamibacterales bacterium]|jgi:ankyrin repeat protein